MSQVTRTGITLLVSLSVVGAAASLRSPDRAVKPEVRSIIGTVRVSDAVGAPEVLPVNADREVCGSEVQLDESLMVDPESLGVKNVVVRIVDMSNAAPARDRDYGRALQQRDCRYDPHVLIVPAGREFSILNWDGILHNTHTRSRTNRPINKAQPGFLKRIPVTLKSPEFIEVGCDVHNWMSAWIVVAEHRFYTVTGELGQFRLDGVPPGTYELEIWHETLGSQTARIMVVEGKDARLDFEYPVPAS